MNLLVITTASALSLAFLALLSYRINKAAARQPILIEQRKIIYRRRP